MIDPTQIAATLPPDYIDSEHTGHNRKLLEAFYLATLAEGGSADEITLRGIHAVIAADRAARPGLVPAELLCELFAFAVMCDSKLKGDGLWDEEHDMSDGLLDRARAEIERQQSAPAAPPSSPHTPPQPRRSALPCRQHRRGPKQPAAAAPGRCSAHSTRRQPRARRPGRCSALSPPLC